MSEFNNIFLKQVGGKYGTFTCPMCGIPGQHWKFSNNQGYCKKCEQGYQGVKLESVSKHSDIDRPEKTDYYASIELLG